MPSSTAPEQTVRPRLTKRDIDLLQLALDDYATASHDADTLKRCVELGARLTTAAEPFARRSREGS